MEGFDTERFISEVEIRPPIWNCRLDTSSEREKAWNDLCLQFVPNFEKKTIQEKDAAASALQRKWKSLRDCFKREHTRQINPKGESCRKSYKYYHKLSFLLKVVKSKGGNNSDVQDSNDFPQSEISKLKIQKRNQNENHDTVQKFTESNTMTQTVQKLNQNKEEETVQHVSELLMATQTEVKEAEWNFALSLLPHLKEIPHEHKLDAQMEILMVLKKYKRFRRQV